MQQRCFNNLAQFIDLLLASTDVSVCHIRFILNLNWYFDVSHCVYVCLMISRLRRNSFMAKHSEPLKIRGSSACTTVYHLFLFSWTNLHHCDRRINFRWQRDVNLVLISINSNSHSLFDIGWSDSICEIDNELGELLHIYHIFCFCWAVCIIFGRALDDFRTTRHL